MIFNIFALLVFFQFKHLVADYFLQGKWMIQKFKPDWGFFLPLLAHAGVHALFTLGVCLFVAPNLWWLAVVDLVAHFIMDRIKAGPKYLGRFKALSGAEYMKTVENEHWAKLSDSTQNNREMLRAINKKRRHNVYFWWALGFDGFIHNLTYLYIVFVLVMDKTI